MSKVLLMLGLPGVTLLTLAVVEEGLPSLDALILPSIVIAILVLINGLFVAAEFAINGVRPTQVDELVESGDKNARLVADVLSSPAKQDRYIATAQLGITVASLGLGMYGEPQIAHVMEPYLAKVLGVAPTAQVVHTISYIVTLSFLTYLHVVIGEMVPKSLALSHALKSALAIARPMFVLELLFQYPVKLLNGTGNLVLRLLRVPPREAPHHSQAELEQIVAESAKQGLLNEAEEDFILNIFSFSDRQVHQVMTSRRKIEAISNDRPFEEMLKLVTDSRYSRFPVYEEDLDHIVGIVHLKDIIRQQLRAKGPFDLRLILKKAPVVPEHYPVASLLNHFKQTRLHMAIVLDEYGGTVGIVTLEDLLEEVVGEVRDEFDRKEVEPFEVVRPGVIEVEGEYLLEELFEEIGLREDESLPDVETVGGLIISQLGRPPALDDEIIYKEDVKITVLIVDGLAIVRAQVEYPPEWGDEPPDDSMPS